MAWDTPTLNGGAVVGLWQVASQERIDFRASLRASGSLECSGALLVVLHKNDDYVLPRAPVGQRVGPRNRRARVSAGRQTTQSKMHPSLVNRERI